MALAYASTVALERAAAARNIDTLDCAHMIVARLERMPLDDDGDRLMISVGRGWLRLTRDEHAALSAPAPTPEREHVAPPEPERAREPRRYSPERCAAMAAGRERARRARTKAVAS